VETPGGGRGRPPLLRRRRRNLYPPAARCAVGCNAFVTEAHSLDWAITSMERSREETINAYVLSSGSLGGHN